MPKKTSKKVTRLKNKGASKVAKTKKVVKAIKPAQTVSSRKTAPKALKQAKTRPSTTPVAKAPVAPPVAVEAVPALPPRPPQRKVIEGGTVIPLPPKPSNGSDEIFAVKSGTTPALTTKQSNSTPTFPNISLVSAPVTEQPKPQAKKIAWNALPANFPPHLKWMVISAQRECENAAAWPFPFAKFFAALPGTLCAMEFVALLLNLDNNSVEIAEICGLDSDDAENLINSARSNFDELFANTCPDLHRKWRTRLGGSGLGVESLIDQHLVMKVDRDFQLAIGSIILLCMGATNPIVNGRQQRDRWSVNARAAN